MTLPTSRDRVIEMTADWEGERSADGRPRVPDDVLRRLASVTSEQAWAVLDAHGYPYQFCGGWQTTHPGAALVGRAVTSAYVPLRPDLDAATRRAGARLGLDPTSQPNAWVVDMLTEGDVMVADIFGKVVEGTVIGDNLGTALAARSRAGAVIDGGVRDLHGLRRLDGVNVYYRAADPTPIRGVVLRSVNDVVTVGGVTVLPGDVVLGTDTGVTFVPAHLAQEIADSAGDVDARDRFGKQMLAAGTYTSAEIDVPQWPERIEVEYRTWLARTVPAGADGDVR